MLPKNFFTANIAVISLSMHEMQLYSIERDAFHNKQFYNLKILKFSRMPIMNFLDGIFNGLHNLKILTLDHVLIHKFGPNVFKPLLSLQSVSIKYCDDHIINIDNLFGFDNLTKLQTVEIEYCNLKDTITNTTFAGLQNIRNLSLRYNQIEQIGLKSFDVPLKTLDMLSLNWNKLKFIPDNLFETDDQFQTNRKLGASIELINNPWHCDYKMENFRQFIRKYIHLKIDPIICKTPFKYSGVYLVKTDDLCNETNEARPIKGLIESKPINEVKFVEEHLSIDISHKDSISVQCKLIKHRIPYSNQQTVHLTKPFDNAVHPVQNKNGKLILDSKYFPMNFSLIGFEESFNNTNKKASNCFINNKDTKSKKVIIKSELIPNVAFQFCWTENGTNLITPLNCMPFHWFVNEDDDNDFWLKIEHKPIVITISVISAAVAPFIGISIACILAKVFPREIRGRRPIQTIASFLTPKEIETVKRIRYVVAIVSQKYFFLFEYFLDSLMYHFGDNQ